MLVSTYELMCEHTRSQVYAWSHELAIKLLYFLNSLDMYVQLRKYTTSHDSMYDWCTTTTQMCDIVPFLS